MMVSLHENLPSLPEFDGLSIHRAHHDPKNQLVFSASAIGDSDPKVQAELLKTLLETHPRWRLRTSAGVVVNVTERKKADHELAKKHVMSALHLLQVNIGEAYVVPIPPEVDEWLTHAWPFEPKLPRVRPTNYDRCLDYLDVALRHDPKNVLAWYLRGYILQTRSRSDLSLRDYRRMVELELDDKELRPQRIEDLELVQGALRQSAYRIEQQAILEVSDGWTLRELRERKEK
jgi:tetratricopeptide (TPR) repeat protein